MAESSLNDYVISVGTLHDGKAIFRRFTTAKGCSMSYSCQKSAIEILFSHSDLLYKFWLFPENLGKIYCDERDYDTFYIKIRRRYDTYVQYKRNREVLWK